MKFPFAVALLAFALVACSEESKVKDAALDGAKLHLEKTVRAEADDKITGKDALVKIYVSTVLRDSEFDVSDVAIVGDSASATVKVRTIPKPVRIAITDIIARLEKARENAFNVSEAMKGTFAVMNKAPGERTESTERVELRNRNGWQALPPAP